jgi:hypothetical protein
VPVTPPPGDYLNQLAAGETVLTGGTTLFPGKLYILGGSGAYTVSLPGSPARGVGQLVGVRCAAGLAQPVTVSGNGALIDGVATRVLWAQEAATLECDGTNWSKVHGHNRPMLCTLYPSANQTINSYTFTHLNTDTASVDNTGVMADLTNKRVTIKRAGTYQVLAKVIWNALPGNTVHQTRIHKNGNGLQAVTAVTGPVAAGTAQPALREAVVDTFAVGDYLETYAYHEALTNQAVFGAAGPFSGIWVTEVPTW